MALYRSYTGTNERAKRGLLVSSIIEPSAWTHDSLSATIGPWLIASFEPSMRAGTAPYSLDVTDTHHSRFGGRFTRQSPCLPGAFPHEQSGGCPGSNTATNRTGNQPGNARDLPRLQTRWRTRLGLLNRPAWNDSEALDEADKRQSDRRTIPTLIGHGFRRRIDVAKPLQCGQLSAR